MRVTGRRSRAYVLVASAWAAAVAMAAGIASADPEDNQLIATTCSYTQLLSALQVEAPDLAAGLAQRPAAQAKLQEFLALPVDQRRQRVTDLLDRNPQWRSTIDEKRDTPEGQQKVAMLRRIADTCHNY